MSQKQSSIVPKTGLKGLAENWQSDLLAAISVSLVALPLGLGIALASGVPPMAGIISAIVGGIVTTLYRGSHIGINGPTAGLIAVVLGSLVALDDGTGKSLNYVLAAVVVSGALQVLLGLFKMGRFADIFHSTVIHGVLAAIGVIIFAKQIHTALGTETEAVGIIETIVDAFYKLPNANPFVVVISLIGLALLIFHSRINYKLFHFLPAPLWVLMLAIPFVYLFDFFEFHELSFLGTQHSVGPDLLIDIPDNIMDSIVHPDFSRIDSMAFWNTVIGITLIASIESLASGKAIDKLDPYRRRTNLNKDLIGIGLGTMVSGLIGGLPVITVIVRSTVNVHNHAKTKWSNFYHGALLLVFIFLLAPVIQRVPLCALAILLVYTGFKLASPKIFKELYAQGIEQLIFFTGTLIITLQTDLLIGILGGLSLALFTHFLLAKLTVLQFFRQSMRPGSHVLFHKDGSYELRIKGIANFLNTIRTEKLLDEIPAGSRVKIDLSGARIVDHSIMEALYDFKIQHSDNGGFAEIVGLDDHISSSRHKLALQISTKDNVKVTPRLQSIREMAEEHQWIFEPERSDDVRYFQSFYFFKTRPINIRFNTISSAKRNIQWEICDVSFEEGALVAAESFKTTLGLIRLPMDIPRFTIEKKGFLDKYLISHKDIDYEMYEDFSSDYTVKVENCEEMKAFLVDEVKNLIEQSAIHHIESNGEALLIFNDNLTLAPISDYSHFIHFLEDMKNLMSKQMALVDNP